MLAQHNNNAWYFLWFQTDLAHISLHGDFFISRQVGIVDGCSDAEKCAFLPLTLSSSFHIWSVPSLKLMTEKCTYKSVQMSVWGSHLLLTHSRKEEKWKAAYLDPLGILNAGLNLQ